jgi:hypothetical protein
MADLTYDADIRLKGEAKTEFFMMDTSAAQTIYKGQPVMIDQTTDTLYVVGYIDSIDVAPTDVFMGIAAEKKSVLLAGAETTEIECYVGPTIVGFKSTVFTLTSKLGATIYMSDSGTLSVTAADNVQIGTLFKIDDGYCYVKLSAPQVCAGSGA